MFLTKLTLLNFKNHESLSLQFSKKLNCFIGKNGVGKTNILDSIYYLCLTKSYFNSVDQQNILFGKDFFRLDGDIKVGVSRSARLNGEVGQGDPARTFHITYKLPPNKRKELLVNEVPVPKLSDHIGKFPCIIISPNDSELITGSSEERRKFLDATISQVNHQYLEWLITYQKVLTQRNAALRQFAETRKTDKQLIETYDRQLVPLGANIYEARKVVIEKLQPLFQIYYKQISLEREPVSFSYYSQLNEKPFAELLTESFERDLILQRTDAGIHKDDLEFLLTPKSLPDRQAGPKGDFNTNTNANAKMKKFGSQGQQKSFIISLKLAQFEFIKQGDGFNPLLLIDDIFDKLDNDRSHQLIDIITSQQFGQVFLTDTDDTHIREVLKGKEGLFEVTVI